MMVGAIATWKSYPTLGDMALWAGLLSCFPELVKSEPSVPISAYLQTFATLSSL